VIKLADCPSCGTRPAGSTLSLLRADGGAGAAGAGSAEARLIELLRLTPTSTHLGRPSVRACRRDELAEAGIVTSDRLSGYHRLFGDEVFDLLRSRSEAWPATDGHQQSDPVRSARGPHDAKFLLSGRGVFKRGIGRTHLRRGSMRVVVVVEVNEQSVRGGDDRSFQRGQAYSRRPGASFAVRCFRDRDQWEPALSVRWSIHRKDWWPVSWPVGQRGFRKHWVAAALACCSPR